MVKIVASVLVMVGAFAAFSSAHAEGGCGIGWHRGPFGGCRVNGGPVYVAPRPVIVAPAQPVVVTPAGAVIYAPAVGACPYGYHLGPQGRRCWPN
jgi:hypothetical protein